MSTSTPRSGQAPESGGAGVLVIHGDASEGERLVRELTDRGTAARFAGDDAVAIDEIVRTRFDVLVVDADLPRTSASELVRVVRAYDVEVPIIVLTEDASAWVGMGVQLVAKPVDAAAFTRAVGRVRSARRDTTRIQAPMLTKAPAPPAEELPALLDRALDAMWIAFQPIVRSNAPGPFGYEALLRSREPKLPSPPAVIDAAEKLGRLDDLGRRVRALASAAFAGAPDDAKLFVNLHPRDLLDNALFDPEAPLTSIAPRVVLELTERANIEEVKDVSARLSVLRFHGFRIAVDDLGAGYAGLTSFATVEPEFVKLDMSLVRNLHTSPVRKRLVASMLDACRDLGSSVVAEGIESKEELHTLRDMGCELFQGYLLARPSAQFEKVTGF